MSWTAAFRSAPKPEALPELRRRIQAEMRSRQVGKRLIDTAGVLISELTHNAVEASGTDHEVLVELHCDESGLHLSVECAGNQDLEGLVLALRESGVLPDPESERGRGLWMILSHARKIEVSRQPGGWVKVSMDVREDPA